MRSGARLDFDVLVVGGGPAGNACAIRLASGGGHVAIVEASDYSRFRVGEILAASTSPLLRQLDIQIGQQEWSASCVGIAASWGKPTTSLRPSILNPYGHGWRIDRRTFDKVLFEQARDAGAAGFKRCRFVCAERRAGLWLFHLQNGTNILTGRAKWIVAATGRSASTPLAPKPSRVWLDRLIGITLVGDCGECRLTRASALVEATPNGWWYSVRVPDGRQIVIFFTDADLIQKRNSNRAKFFLNELDEAPLTSSDCKFAFGLISQYRWTGFDARSSILRLAMFDGWLAIGDARMAFDPLCGRGISEAIGSGMEAADWLLHSCGREPNSDVMPSWIQSAANRFNQYQTGRLAIYGHERRWLSSIFWQRRQPGEFASRAFPPGVSTSPGADWLCEIDPAARHDRNPDGASASPICDKE